MTSPRGELRASRAPLPGPLGRAAAWCYGQAIGRINARFDGGRGVVTLDRPVISVGNLSTGGTGKTPMVMRVLAWLRAGGHDPCVAMRGSGSRAGAASAEARAYARAVDDLPVVARPDRVGGLIELFATPRGERVDSIVLDDGFQHRKIARTLDLVLLDATRPIFEDALLPAGHLREPVESLARAGGIVITHAESAHPDDVATLRVRAHALAPRAIGAVARHAWKGLVDAQEGAAPADALRGRRVGVACAIANPDAFVDMARQATGEPAGVLTLPDHDAYGPAGVDRLLAMLRDARCDALLVTEKDWSKLRRVHASRWPCPVFRPRLGLAFDLGEGELRRAVLEAARPAPDIVPDCDEPSC